MYYMMGNGMGIMGFWGWIMMIVIWALVICGFIYLMDKMMRGKKRENRREEDDAVEILKKRYARGEVDETEFQEMKHNLEELGRCH